MIHAGQKMLLPLICCLWMTQALAHSRQAPEWDIAEWLNGDGRTVESLQGKVVVVEFFQLWCPGCNNFSIPLMARWESKYADAIAADRLMLVSIHTVFEGHSHQMPVRLRSFLEAKSIRHLVGIDRHLEGREIPETMRRYRTRGTPEMAIIDQRGRIRFQRFGGFDPAEAEALLDALLNTQQE